VESAVECGEIRPVNFDTDWEGIDHLLTKEEWPIVRADLEASHGQPVGEFLVASKDDSVHGFFATHAFEEIGYLDMTRLRGNRLPRHDDHREGGSPMRRCPANVLPRGA
jgi:hypothetical protein